MTQRWTFYDPATLETWRLPRNPQRMTPPVPLRRTRAERDAFGNVRISRTGVGTFPWEFQGRVHSQDEYDTFEDWAGRNQVVVTDHLGREHLVIPVAFDPTPYVRNGTRNPWLFDYTFRAQYIRRQA